MLPRRLFNAALAGSVAVGNAARAQSFTMQLTTTASNDIDQEWLTQFKRAVEAGSGGRIHANVYPGSQLGSAQTTIEGVTMGTIEVAINASGTYEALEPRFAVLAVPGLIQTMAQGEALLASPGTRARMDTVGRDKGVQVLTVTGVTPVGLVSRRPIRTLADVKGMKIRVPGSALLMEQLKQLGAAPIAMSLGEVLPAFQNGTIDAVYAATTIFSALKYYDISKNMTLLPGGFIAIVAIVSSDFMASIGPLATVVRDAAHQADQLGVAWSETDVDHARALWTDHGGQVFSLPPDEAARYLEIVVPVALKALTPAARADYDVLKAVADGLH